MEKGIINLAIQMNQLKTEENTDMEISLVFQLSWLLCRRVWQRYQNVCAGRCVTHYPIVHFNSWLFGCACGVPKQLFMLVSENTRITIQFPDISAIDEILREEVNAIIQTTLLFPSVCEHLGVNVASSFIQLVRLLT